MLSKLADLSKVAGAKQTRRALADGKAAAVYLAQDADPRITEQFRALCRDQGVSVYDVPSMKELGEACGIPVGAAVAALLR